MIVCHLRTYDFRGMSTRMPASRAAFASVKLDVKVGADGDLVLLPVVDLVESTRDPSPCLTAALIQLLGREESPQVRSLGIMRATRFLSDEHPETLMGWISGTSTQTRRISARSEVTDLDDALLAVEDGMRKAQHHLMIVRSLHEPGSSSTDDVEYWTNAAIRMSDRWRVPPNRVSVTTTPHRTGGLRETISYLARHPRLKRAWERG